MKVTNHTTEIEKALHLDEGSVKHEGNFSFRESSTGIRFKFVRNPPTTIRSR